MKRFILMCLGIATFVSLGMARAEKNNTQTTETKPKEKRKVLILQIIEENWDNLEFTPPLYDIIGSEYKPPTKRQVMEEKYMNVTGTKEGILKGLNYRISLGKVPQNLKFYVVHTIKYFGKTDELKDDDALEESIYRFDKCSFGYYYPDIPEKISLLTEPQFGVDYKCFHIRLVEDVEILSSDTLGNLKIKYDGKDYNLKVNDKVEFPIKKVIMTKEEIIKWAKNYKEKVEKRLDRKIYHASIPSILRNILTEGNIYFKTKITVINRGYVEVEL